MVKLTQNKIYLFIIYQTFKVLNEISISEYSIIKYFYFDSDTKDACYFFLAKR